MPTARGTATRISANRITLQFVVDDIQVTFTGTISPAIQPFSANVANLTYDSLEDLTSTHSYSGRIGPQTFKLDFNNGVKAEGNLEVPGISPASTVDGTGAWEQN
ncbi:hypothetical protein ACHAPJ_009713 [Fusarium lateritium]